jgi:hypothetical protein
MTALAHENLEGLHMAGSVVDRLRYQIIVLREWKKAGK